MLVAIPAWIERGRSQAKRGGEVHDAPARCQQLRHDTGSGVIRQRDKDQSGTLDTRRKGKPKVREMGKNGGNWLTSLAAGSDFHQLERGRVCKQPQQFDAAITGAVDDGHGNTRLAHLAESFAITQAEMARRFSACL